MEDKAEVDRTCDILPKDVSPVHYTLSLFDLDIDGPSRDFCGKIDIDLVVQKSTHVVVVNARNLNLESAQIVALYGDVLVQDARKIRLDDEKQRCSIEFPEPLPACESVTRLRIVYKGKIDDQLTSFYRFEDAFLAESSHQFGFTCSTQFQPSDARQAFPCFDEPGIKASFQLSVEIPTKLNVLSNTPVSKREKSTRNPSCDVVSFETTPVMSTYLVAWAIGGFEYIETTLSRRDTCSPLPIRVYTPPGLKEKGRFALEMAGRCVEFFSQIFEIDFPLPKLDLLGVLELSDDAMENWGLITFRTTALLVDEETSNVNLTRCLYILAHEIAHSWFGNLVTMSWWDELWLNEGFATWAGWTACNHFYPEWDVWGQFINDDMEEALMLDALPSTHPVHVHVPDGLEVDSIFDSISYLKSASIIRMLADSMGEQVFLKGVATYLRRHAYKNTVGQDLWTALSETSGKDVEKMMNTWIRQRGFPLVSVEAKPLGCGLRQDPYTSLARVDTSEPWSIPLRLVCEFDVVDEVLEIDLGTIEKEFFKINANQGGFYRAIYAEERLTMILANLSRLSKYDQIGLLNDMSALAYSGYAVKSTFVLSSLAQFADSDDFIVWQAVISALERFRSIFGDDAQIRGGLDTFAINIAEKHVHTLGWSFQPGESYNMQTLRVLLISFAGRSGHDTIASEACRRFKAWIAGDVQIIHPWLRPVVFQIVVQVLGAEAIQDLLALYDESKSYEIRAEIVAAMGSVSEPELSDHYLKLAFNSSIVPQDLCTLCKAMASNPICRKTFWNFMRSNWPVIFAKIGHTMALFNPLIQHCLASFANESVAKEVAIFFEDKDLTGFRSGLSVAQAFIDANVSYRQRNVDSIREWLESWGRPRS